MKLVKVYTIDYCPYCVRAKNLLNQFDIPFDEINLTDKYQEITELKNKTKLSTLPQIFIGDEFIGGFQELLALSKKEDIKKKIQG